MAGMLVTAFVASNNQHAQQADLAPFSGRAHHTPTLSTEALDFTISNEYTGTAGETTAYTWLEGPLVEPHRVTCFQVSQAQVGITYTWTITSITGKKYVYVGEAVNHTFTVLGVHNMKLSASKVSIDGVHTYQETETTLSCKYVRREIRSLLLEERKDLLSAMSVLWKVEKSEGTKLYGEDYIDIWTINRLHFRAATDAVCDHFHDGLGFLVAHSAVTLVFEQSLRLVNPKLSMPYWDFTIEGGIVNLEYDGDLNFLHKASPLFTDEYFGSTDPDDLMVKDGLWGYTKIQSAAEEGLESQNVYGLMRSPWDVNGRPYLTRGMGAVCSDRYITFGWPTCEMHYNLNVEMNSFYDWVWDAMYDPHGTVHIWVGGLIDCEGTFDRLANITGDRMADDLRSITYVTRKTMYKAGYWGCQGEVGLNVTAHEVMDTGVCGCLGYDLHDDGDVQFLLNNIRDLKVMTGGLDREQKRAVMRALCEGVQSTGEQLGPSSPTDPSFWPIHPTMERLYQQAQLSGMMTDVSWPSQGSLVTAADGTIYEIKLSMEEECVGHNAADVFPYGLVEPGEANIFFDMIEEGAPVRRSDMTNVDLLKAFDPRSKSLPYVYDNMDWSHCLEEGLDFSKMGQSSRSTKDMYTVFKAGDNPLDYDLRRRTQMMSISK